MSDTFDFEMFDGRIIRVPEDQRPVWEELMEMVDAGWELTLPSWVEHVGQRHADTVVGDQVYENREYFLGHLEAAE